MFRASTTSIAGVSLRAYKVYVRPIPEYGKPAFSPYKKSIQILESSKQLFEEADDTGDMVLLRTKNPVVWKGIGNSH